MIRTLSRRPARTLAALLGGLLLGFAGGLAVWYFLPRQPEPAAQGSLADSATGAYEIPALGRLEPRGGIIPIYGTPGDRILEFENKADQVGQKVKAGATLVEMASDKLRKMEVDIADRQLNDANQQLAAVKEAAAAKKLEANKELENLKRSRLAELEAQRSKLKVAELQVEQGKANLARVRSLSAGSVAQADLEQQALLVRKGEEEVESGKASLKVAEQALADSEELARVKRAAAEAEEKRAIQAVPIDVLTLAARVARAKQEIGRVHAPVTGTVVRVQTLVGETTSQVKPILLLAAAGPLVVRAEIPDAEVEHVSTILAKGDTFEAAITSRTLKELHLEGNLARPEQLARTISRNAVIGLTPGDETDRRVIEATIEIPEPTSDKDAKMFRLARSVLGLQVEVTLKIRAKK